MTKKAFVIGIDTMGLKYCQSDAVLIGGCLKKHDYEVTMVKDKQTKWQILPKFSDMLDNCGKTDMMIFYFSGHGMIEGGKLYLITEEDATKEKNKILVNEITNPLSNCLAENKLIILDCCHAGKASADWKPDPSEAYRLLMAANPLQRNKELEELQGSFLTNRICQALKSRSNEVAKEGKIYLNALSDWLHREAERNNGTEGAIKVPDPYLFGKDINIQIAVVIGESLTASAAKERASKVDAISSFTQRPYFEEYNMLIAPGGPSDALQKPIPRQSTDTEKTQIKKLEKIKELENKGLLYHDAASMLQFKIAEELLKNIGSVADSL